MPRQFRQNSRALLAAERRARRLYERTSRAAARSSLVYGPYVNEDARCSIETAVGGACTKLRRRYARPKPGYAIPVRGKVWEFSRKSRTRLQQTLCAVPVAHVGRGLLFITLTYPAQWPGQWEVWKAQLDHLTVKLRRKFPRAGGVWKLEPQTRGAPHFHLLVVGVPFIASEWLHREWSSILHPGIFPQPYVRVDIQLAKSHRGVVSYASKYVAKKQKLPADWQEGVGRWWGMFGRKSIGIVWKWAPLSQDQFWQVTRIVRQVVRHRRSAVGRGPPRPSSNGSWAVLRDWQALRIARHVLDTSINRGPQQSRECIALVYRHEYQTCTWDCRVRHLRGAESAHQFADALLFQPLNAAPQAMPR